MVVDTNPFPEVSSNMVTLDLSKLTKSRSKIEVGQTNNILAKNKYGKGPARTIHDQKMSHEDKQKAESVSQTDLSAKIDLSKKMIDELLDEIKEQQIELIK